MLMGDKKKVVSIIVGGLQPGYVGKKDGAMEGEYKTPDSEAAEAQVDAAEALIEGVKAGDAKAVAKAFNDLMTLCGDSDTYPDHDDEDM